MKLASETLYTGGSGTATKIVVLGPFAGRSFLDNVRIFTRYLSGTGGDLYTCDIGIFNSRNEAETFPVDGIVVGTLTLMSSRDSSLTFPIYRSVRESYYVAARYIISTTDTNVALGLSVGVRNPRDWEG